jgi:probable rRNA maturation factor
VDAPALRRALAAFLVELGQEGRGISVLLGDDEALHALNLAHRGEDRTTDVLSWSYLETEAVRPKSDHAGAAVVPLPPQFPSLHEEEVQRCESRVAPRRRDGGEVGGNRSDRRKRDAEGAVPLGDLALSLDRARAQAQDNGWPLQTELLRVLAHGCAHLAGYDHRTAAEERLMRGVEEALLEKVGLRGLYPKGGSGD